MSSVTGVCYNHHAFVFLVNTLEDVLCRRLTTYLFMYAYKSSWLGVFLGVTISSS